MLIIWNENFIIKNFKFHFREWNKDIWKRKKYIELDKNQLIWMIEKITDKKIGKISIETGFLDYPLIKKIKKIYIGRIEITINNHIVKITKNKESELILYKVLNLYSELNNELTQKKILSLIRRKEIKIRIDNPTLIPKLAINGIDITTIINY